MAHLRCDIKSDALGMNTSLEVVLPDEGKLKDAPVIYLLHGLSDNCTRWTRYTAIERYARDKGAAVIMPEVQRSFYADMAMGPDYFTYVSKELPQICAHFFGLTNKREKNFVMGLSMGGYGALKCALTNPKQYAGCASFSAVTEMDSRAARADERFSRELQAIFGMELKMPPESSLQALLAKRKSFQLPKFFITCGEQDMLYPENCRFAEALEKKGAAVSFNHWPGDHTWDLWDRSVDLAIKAFL